MYYCRAQRNGARLGNRDVAPIARCSLGSENVKCMSRFWPPGPPYKFGTRDLHLLLGVSKYIANERGIFSSMSIALDLEARWR